jgi:hypothetical protein
MNFFVSATEWSQNGTIKLSGRDETQMSVHGVRAIENRQIRRAKFIRKQTIFLFLRIPVSALALHVIPKRPSHISRRPTILV